MSAIGDQLREFAEVCDRNPELVAFGAIIAEGVAFNFMSEFPKDKREAFELVRRTLGGTEIPPDDVYAETASYG